MSNERIDWSQVWFTGPTRVFTPDEMARAGNDAPSRTFKVVLMGNFGAPALAVLLFASEQNTARLTALLAGAAAIIWHGLMAVWRQPHRRRLMAVSLVALATMVLFMLGLRWRMAPGPDRVFMGEVSAIITGLAVFGYYGLAFYRSQQIAARLRELDERERRTDMARQLAQAQIQPHFLFNSLASLQHWVQQKDDRAAPLLDALTGFLRATLPLFDRRMLTVGEEAAAVHHYLSVMQLRLGERLRWQLEIGEDAGAVALPPGLLLTLVENALEHGVQRSLAGADVHVSARRDGERLVIEVRDTGPGLAAQAVDGVGLGNARARLAQVFGAHASLAIDNDPAGGCRARIECPATSIAPDTGPEGGKPA
jgi:signal transduction histidine kinase